MDDETREEIRQLEVGYLVNLSDKGRRHVIGLFEAALARAERAEARVAELEAQLAAAQPAIEAWAQYQADNERRAQLQEDMVAEGLIKRPFWQ